MTPIDKKMFQAIKFLKSRGDIRYTREFCNAIKMDQQTLRNVKIDRSHFRSQHIKNACKEYNINANWIFGLSDQFSRVTAEIKFISEAKPGNKKENKQKNQIAR